MSGRCKWAAVLLCTAAFGAAAATPAPVEYGTKNGWGSLQISGQGGVRQFEIEAVGANGHTCALSGTLRGEIAEATDGSDTPCRVSFKRTPGGFEVTPLTEDSCRDYCGARAGFDGEYLALPPGCTAAASGKRRAAYLADYRGKRYAAALAGMDAFGKECGTFFNWLERDRFANDRAIALLRLGRPKDCLAALDSTIAGASRDEDSLQQELDKNGSMLPPSDWDSYLPIAKSTWFNRKLCEAAK
ncbi:hypothetical protein [Xanthomonas sp. 1678]|uniref:hypothetical protein n=1 Tax=Xanthomonas sp. 1678 TaxID=3158788 RepID=UPI002863FF74|nr:hypothetical protein [Xanthomonas translucens]